MLHEHLEHGRDAKEHRHSVTADPLHRGLGVEPREQGDRAVGDEEDLGVIPARGVERWRVDEVPVVGGEPIRERGHEPVVVVSGLGVGNALRSSGGAACVHDEVE